MKKLIIAGLGPGPIGHMSQETLEIISRGYKLILRTGRHPAAEDLARRGILFTTYDNFYEEKKTFEEVYRSIVDDLITLHENNGDTLVYCVPGNPLLYEDSVELLLCECKKRKIEYRIIPAMSFVDTLLPLIGISSVDGLLLLDALKIKASDINTDRHTIFVQVYNRFVAADLKLLLLEFYSPQQEVIVVRAAGVKDQEKKETVMLCEMDHLEWFDHLTSVYIAPIPSLLQKRSDTYSVEELFTVMERLLSPQGCPWDREQDHNSLKPYLVEETYEVIEAIDEEDMGKMQEELGDLLLQIVFHAMLAQNSNHFQFKDIVKGISEKMIRRHPHVFGNVQAANSDEVLKNWEQIKAREKAENEVSIPGEKRVLAGINRSLPALLLAQDIQKKARKAGFDWKDINGPWDKVFEEINELKDAAGGNNTDIEDELGDLLFAVVNLARFLKVCPETALYKTIGKFKRRFEFIEDKIWKNNLNWAKMDLQSLDIFWEEAKKSGI